MAKANTQNVSIVIAEGQLITVDKPPTKQQYNKGQSNFWFDKQKNAIHFREGQKKDKSIQLSFQNGQYQYEGIVSSNIYEIIVRTSIFSLLFGGQDPHVGVTEESLRLPFEEQPWFIGAADKGELKLLEQAETRMFFTRAKGPKVYLHWTTTKRLKNPERPILLDSNDLSLVLPRGEFITARYNRGTVNYLNEFLFCRSAATNDLIKMKRIASEKGVNLASPILHDPNIISYYIENIPKEEINEELILWLLEQGLSVDRGDKDLAQLAVSKCSTIVLESLLQRGAYCPEAIAVDATKRNLPLHRLETYWKAYCNQKPTFRDFMDIVLHYKQDMHQKQVLIMLAWRYGNSENHFKLLPKELVKHIISYDLGEIEAEQPWFELAHEIFTRSSYTEIPLYSTNPVLLKMLSFFWKYWAEITPQMKDMVTRLLFQLHYYEISPAELKIWLHWLVKFSQRHRTFTEESDYVHSQLAEFISSYPDLVWIKHLISTGVVKKEWYAKPSVRIHNPLAWRALDYFNKVLVEFLFQEKMMPLVSPSKTKITLENYLQGHAIEKINFFHKMVVKYNRLAELEKLRSQIPLEVDNDDDDNGLWMGLT